MFRRTMLILLSAMLLIGVVGCSTDADSPKEDSTASATAGAPASAAGTAPGETAPAETATPDATTGATADATETPGVSVAGGTLYQLSDTKDAQMMSYMIKTDNNKLIMLDGGYGRNKVDIIDLAKKITGKAVPEIEAWFFSHTHNDHVEAFSELMIGVPKDPDDPSQGMVNDYAGALNIKKIYYNITSKAYVEAQEPGSLKTYEKFVQALDQYPKGQQVVVQPGDVITIDGIKIEVLLVPDESAKPGATSVAINEASVVYRFTIGGQRVLFLGDIYTASSSRLVRAYKNDLQADVVQMAHHGSQGAPMALYKKVAPKACLWPTPKWLWENDQGKGYNTGPWECVSLSKYMTEQLGVKAEHHYVAKDGLIELKFPMTF